MTVMNVTDRKRANKPTDPAESAEHFRKMVLYEFWIKIKLSLNSLFGFCLLRFFHHFSSLHVLFFLAKLLKYKMQY